MTRALEFFLLASTLMACGGPKNSDPELIDEDGDGWEQSVDCDDTDPQVHPEATEICDEIDNNCDGNVDEGVTTTFYEDADLDGYGNPDVTVEACSTREGVVNNAIDCNDANPATNPYATEICDYEDNDCDGLTDENVTSTFYMDLDGDGWGDPANTVQACDTSQDGVVDNADDCDDTDAQISPDAMEYCDGVDNDCDTVIDEDDALDARSWYLDSDGDGYGDATKVRLSCEQPIGYSDNEFDCDDSSAANHPSAPEYCDDADNDCDGTVDEDDAVDASTWYLDSDGDGWGDDDITVVQCYLPTSGSYSSVGDDCDDSDADINPDADEVCDDSIDNDCDGLTDDSSAVDADELWLDSDGDGYGDPSTSITSCTEESGYVYNDDDCDDSDADVNPDADEVCDDGIDNDCDGGTDDSNAVDTVTYYYDSDGDGYGDPSSSMGVCETAVPPGYVDDDSDCDDTDATIYPGADEYCDSVDEDCDGTADNDPLDGDTYYLDSDGDGYGVSTTSTVACSEPSGYADNDDDCDDTDASINPDTVWYYDADRDGYASSSATSYTQCRNPGGAGSVWYTTETGDCRPSDSSSYPGATEVCVSGCGAEGIDNDCDGTVDDGCPEIHGGTISSDETWSASEDHYVVCDTYVQGSSTPLLTIEDGAAVEFANGTSLRVGWSNYGSIDIQGTSSGVEFTSTSGTSGAWDGLLLYQYSSGSTVEGLAISDAGGNVYYPGAITVYSGEAEITDSTIQDSGSAGIYIYNSEVPIEGTTIDSSDGYGIYCVNSTCLDPTEASFIDNTISNSGSYPIRLYANDVGSLDSSSTFSGNTDDFVYVVSGTVDETTSWQNLDVPYYVNATVYVQGASPHPILTIEDGTELQFNTNAGLRVGYSNYGDLVVDGSSSGVLMTSAQDSSRRDLGDWYGVGLHYYTSSSSQIDGLTIEYAGGSSSWPAGLYLGNPDPLDVSDSTFQYNENSGVYVNYQGGAAFESCTFQNNETYGLYLANGARLEGDLTSSVLTGNGSYPISLASYYLDNLDTSTSFAGNTNDYVRVTHSGYVDYDAEWKALDVPYHVVNRLYVQGSSGPVVTIDDDSEWYFDTGTGIVVGNSNYGDLVVDGDSSDGTSVLFSSYSSSLPGKWDGLVLGYYSTGLSSLAGFELEYAGGNTTWKGGIYVYYSDVAISDCDIHDNEQWGIYLSYASSLSLTDCSVESTAATSTSTNGDGVYLSSNSSITSWSSNTLTDNERYPLRLPANELSQLDSSSTYSGNGSGYDYVVNTGGTVTESGTWSALDVPYFFESDTSIQRSGSTATPPEITVSGAEIYMGMGTSISVGTGNYGDFTADSTVFTSQRDITGSTPSNGDWDGIRFGWYTTSTSGLTNSEVYYAGGDSYYLGAVYLNINKTSPDITSNDISYSKSYGIYCNSKTYCASANISGNTATGTNTSGNTNSNCPGW